MSTYLEIGQIKHGRVQAEVDANAPIFQGDRTGYVNRRAFSNTVWFSFCEEVGITYLSKYVIPTVREWYFI